MATYELPAWMTVRDVESAVEAKERMMDLLIGPISNAIVDGDLGCDFMLDENVEPKKVDDE